MIITIHVSALFVLLTLVLLTASHVLRWVYMLGHRHGRELEASLARLHARRKRLDEHQYVIE